MNTRQITVKERLVRDLSVAAVGAVAGPFLAIQVASMLGLGLVWPVTVICIVIGGLLGFWLTDYGWKRILRHFTNDRWP